MTQPTTQTPTPSVVASLLKNMQWRVPPTVYDVTVNGNTCQFTADDPWIAGTAVVQELWRAGQLAATDGDEVEALVAPHNPASPAKVSMRVTVRLRMAFDVV